MITNKDLSIDSENGKIILNGDKYDLGTQGEIDTAVKDVYSVMGQNGAKNLIPYPYFETTKTQNGVTFTDNGDGSLTVDTAGEATTGNAIFFCQTPNVVTSLITLDKNKTYILSDTTKSSIASTYTLGIRYFPEGVVPSTTTGTAVSCNSSNNWQAEISNAVSAYVYIYVYSGKTVNNITFKPMLRLASDTDNTYEPYAMTNKQLTEQVADVQDTIGDITQTGITGASVAAQLENLDGKINDLPVIVSGQANFPAAAIGSQDIEVQFPAGAFTSAPIVTATMFDTTPFNVELYMEAGLYVYNVTKDSFYLRGTRKNANYTWKANWIAVQM